MNTLASAIPFLLQTAPAVYTGFKGKNLGPQKRIASEMSNLANAQYNPNNPIYQRLYESERQQGQQDLASTIAEISRQNRKLTSMGRRPLLDQERGGEQVFRNLIQGYQDVGNQARFNTTNQLGNAQRALGGVYDAYDQIGDQQYDNRLRKVGGYYSLGDALKGLFGL